MKDNTIVSYPMYLLDIVGALTTTGIMLKLINKLFFFEGKAAVVCESDDGAQRLIFEISCKEDGSVYGRVIGQSKELEETAQTQEIDLSEFGDVNKCVEVLLKALGEVSKSVIKRLEQKLKDKTDKPTENGGE